MDLFNPEAKNPPNGPTILAKAESTKVCTWSLCISKLKMPISTGI
jgi:hypothetical protein